MRQIWTKQVNYSAEQIEKLLDLIYDAAAENDLWRSALTAIADLTGSQGGVIFGQSVSAQKVYFDFNGRLDAEYNRIYQERHMRNPWSIFMETQPVGRLVMSDEVTTLPELHALDFYTDVLRPQGLAHNGMIALAAKRDFRAAFNLCRSARKGPFDSDGKRLLNMLSPHMRRAVTLGFRIDGYLAMQNAAFDVLDRVADGVVVLDRNAHSLFANTTANRFTAEGLLRFQQVISTYSAVHSQRLSNLIRSALQGDAGGSMSLPHHEDGRLLTILVTSVRSKELGRLSDAGIKDAAVLLFIIDPLSRRSISPAQIIDAYGLTLSEARVALAASSGNTISEAAELLKLSPNTVKTHLRRVFAKTSTARQTELTALITAVGSIRISEPDNVL